MLGRVDRRLREQDINRARQVLDMVRSCVRKQKFGRREREDRSKAAAEQSRVGESLEPGDGLADASFKLPLRDALQR